MRLCTTKNLLAPTLSSNSAMRWNHSGPTRNSARANRVGLVFQSLRRELRKQKNNFAFFGARAGAKKISNERIAKLS